MELKKIQRTPAFDRALSLMEKGGPFTFITGRAGTGKSTLLNYFCETTNLSFPVLAPTGVAALNVNGETIHRFFKFAPGITVKDARKRGGAARALDIYRNADLLVIDEISMVRADLLDCMDAFLRAARKCDAPFGGLRLVAIGDLYQLPPVVNSVEREAFVKLYHSPYFFASRVMQDLVARGLVDFVELETVYRQSDPDFIALLNAVRNRSVTQNDLAVLNSRTQTAPSTDAIVLTSINAAADALNETRLRKLAGKVKVFHGIFRGDFPEREAPTDAALRLKVSARVMCVANDPSERFVNGSLGWIKGFETTRDESSVIVKLDEGRTVSITQHVWTIYRSVYDSKTHALGQERLGSFTQVPLRLAWAVTIHKSQGKTFDCATIDLGPGAFAAGQTYVALSRCRAFGGLTLARPVKLQDIRLDYSIVKFVTSLQYQIASRSLSLEEKLDLLSQAAKDKQRLTIVYLKGKDEKSERVIIPNRIEEAEYAGHPFLALYAWCELRQEERTFNVERILDISFSPSKGT